VYQYSKGHFSDPEYAKRVTYAFDFEWAEQNLLYDMFTFVATAISANSDLASSGEPKAELEILETLPRFITARGSSPSLSGLQ